MKFNFFFFLYLSIIQYSSCQNNHALVVAIGDYPIVENRLKNWQDLSSINDVELVKDLLAKQNFQDKNICVLMDQKATAANLHHTFDSIINQLEKGDVFYFHFSGHGQRVADVDKNMFPNTKFLGKDEEDGLDEVLVLYNAPLNWDEKYTLDEHFIDDQLNHYMNLIRKKIGPQGQVIVVIDACHSGTATRGAESIVVRGSNEICAPKGYQANLKSQDKTIGFDADFQFLNSKDLAQMVAFFGCKSEQVNRETVAPNGKGYGSLSYFFTKSVLELKDKASYQNLFSKINEHMIISFRNQQQPVIEGDNLNSLVFNGGLVVQKPYFNLLKLDSKSTKIDGGLLQGIQVGDSIGFYSNVTLNQMDGKQLFNGIVSSVEPYASQITLSQQYNGTIADIVKYRAFVISSVNQLTSIKLKLNIRSKPLKKEMTNYFSEVKNIQLVESNFDYQMVDTIINKQNYVIIYIGNNQTNALRSMTFRHMETPGILDSFSLYLTQSIRTDVFRKLDLSSSSVSFDVQIFKCLTNCASKNPSFDTSNVVGNFQVKEAQKFRIEIKNTSKKTIYLNVVDIYPTNQVQWLDEGFRNIAIRPGEFNDPITTTVFPPYGIEQFKIIATDRPLDLNQLEENGTSLSRGSGDEHPLLDFVDKSMNNTRGGVASQELGASVKTINFEIIK
jgi:hypothetical protein